MVGIVDQLQSAGFSDDEIGAASTQLRSTLGAAGFSDQEIDETLGGPKKPPPPAFLDRVVRGLGVNGLFDEIGKAGVDTFKTQALAPPLSPETEEWARNIGLFNKPGEASPVRTLNEALLKSSASAFAVMSAAFSAGVSEIGAGVGGISRRLGVSETQSEAARRETENLANFIVANQMAGGAHTPMTRIERTPTGEVHDVPIGAFPENSDFANASRAVAGTPAPVAAVRAKIEALWQDHGIHPAEVVHDAETDPTIAQDLASSSKELPQAYVAPERPAPVRDVDAAAREIAPEVFSEYDPLTAQRDTLRGMLDDLTEQRAQGTSPEITALDREIEQLRTTRLEAAPAERANLANQVTALETRRAGLVDEIEKPGDTPAIARVRADLQTVDYRMRDLAPKVSDAYRQAGGGAATGSAAVAAPPELPPVPEGHVRMFSSAGTEANGSRWATPYYDYARNYHGGGSAVDYVDIPIDHPSLVDVTGASPAEHAANGTKPQFGSSILPADVAANFKPAIARAETLTETAPASPAAAIAESAAARAETSAPGLLQRLMRDESGAVSLGGTPTPPRTAAERAILDRVDVGGQPKKQPWTWSRLYTNIVDALYPISKTTGRATAELGREISTSDNPYQLARLMAGAAGKADHWLNFGTFDFATYENNGPSLKTILEPVKDDLDGLRAFATSVRTLELENRGIKTGMNLGAAREVAQAGLDRYTPVLADLIQYQDRLTRYLRDSGVLSAKGYEAMREANELYVPFHRVFDQSEVSGFGGPSLQAQNPIHRIKGSERAIVDPIESIIRNTFLYVQMAERNAVGVKLVDLLREAGDAHGVRDVSEAHLRDAVSSPATVFADRTVIDVDGAPLPPSAPAADLFPERGPIAREAEPAARVRSAAPEEAVGEAIREALRAQGLSDELFDFMASSVTPAENEIGIFRDGKREVWQVDRELAGAMKALDRQSIGAFERLLSKPASWLRAGAVLTPDFQLRHTFRDYLYAAITSPGFFSPVDMARGLIGLLQHDVDFQNWEKSGGANISMVALDRRYLQENLRQLNGDTGLLVRAWNVIADPDALYTAKAKEIAALPFRAADKFVLNPLRMLTELAENASHLGAFKKAMGAAEETSKEAIQAAGFASRDIAVDASRIGARTRAYNMITAFANITIQDTDRVARAFINNPTSTALKIGGAIVLPSALLWWANHDDTRYGEIPQWEKDLFWIVMTGKNTPADPDYVPGHIFRIPKPWGMGVIFGSGTERTLQAYFDGRPDALREFGKSIADTVVPQFYPSAAAPIIDQFANRNTFTNRTLVPGELEKQLPEYQYTPYTTETAKRLAQLIAAFPGVRQESLDMESPLAGGVARTLTTPILLENYLRAWSGNLGVYALQIADAGLRKAGLLPDPPRPADTLADIPVVKAFVVRYPGAGAESIELFYRGYELNKRFFDTWMAKAQEGDAAAMARIQDAGGPRLFVQLDGIRQTLTEHSQLVRDIWKDPEMPPDEKRQLIDQIYYSQIQIAQAGRTMMTAVDKALAAMPADATVH